MFRTIVTFHSFPSILKTNIVKCFQNKHYMYTNITHDTIHRKLSDDNIQKKTKIAMMLITDREFCFAYHQLTMLEFISSLVQRLEKYMLNNTHPSLLYWWDFIYDLLPWVYCMCTFKCVNTTQYRTKEVNTTNAIDTCKQIQMVPCKGLVTPIKWFMQMWTCNQVWPLLWWCLALWLVTTISRSNTMSSHCWTFTLLDCSVVKVFTEKEVLFCIAVHNYMSIIMVCWDLSNTYTAIAIVLQV